MTQVEKIKAEVEGLQKRYKNGIQALEKECYTNNVCAKYLTLNAQTKIDVCRQILSFINSLPAEPVSEDLEKELSNQMDSIYPLPEEDDFDDPCYSISNAIKNQRIGFKKGFKVGVNWQKEQTMAKAVDGEAGYIGQYYGAYL